MNGVEKIKSFGLDKVDEFTLIHLYLRASDRQKQKLLNYNVPDRYFVRLLSFILLDSIYYSITLTIIRVIVMAAIFAANMKNFSDAHTYIGVNYSNLIMVLGISIIVFFVLGSFTNKRFEKSYKEACKVHAFHSNLYFKFDKTNASKILKTFSASSNNPFVNGLAMLADEKIKKL